MAESMRGSRLGSTSYESENAENAPRQLTTFICPTGHQITLPFFFEADEIPDTWECECGETAIRFGVDKPETKAVKVAKSHYDMLMERRTKKDLENLLKERMDLLRNPKKAS